MRIYGKALPRPALRSFHQLRKNSREVSPFVARENREFVKIAQVSRDNSGGDSGATITAFNIMKALLCFKNTAKSF